MQDTHNPQEARRWAKYPATLLFALSLVWLVRMVFGLNPASIKDETETGIGSFRVLYELAVIPLGSAVCGLGLLFLQPWAYIPAAVLPLWPLIVVTTEKIQRIDTKFSQFHQTQDFAVLGDAILSCLALAGLWVIYCLALVYLRKSYVNLTGWNSWARPAAKRLAPGHAGAQGGGYGQSADEGEVCWLMPELDEEEQN